MNLLISILGPLALLVITIGGFFTIASGGKTEYVQRGRTAVKQALLGFVITLASWVIVTGLIHVLTGTPFTQLTIACNDDPIVLLPSTGTQSTPDAPTCLIIQEPVVPIKNNGITLNAQSTDDVTPPDNLQYRWEGIPQIDGETTKLVDFIWDGNAAIAKVTVTDTDGKSTSCSKTIAAGNCSSVYAGPPPSIAPNLQSLAQSIVSKGIRTRTGTDTITTAQVLQAWASGVASQRHTTDCDNDPSPGSINAVDGSNIVGDCWVTPSLGLLTNLNKLVSNPSTKNKTVVTRLTNGRHYCRSNHYRGSGVDLGSKPGELTPDDLSSLGITCADEGDHYHCSW